MDREEVGTSVPTQIVEIIRPSRKKEVLARAKAKQKPQQPNTPSVIASETHNRLIWTSDNLLALQTLLEERDPATQEPCYRSKVDLIYIDPPFMANTNFKAENTVHVELEPACGIQADKEPSLVELLVYKDTWHQGLDSFLYMIRERLLLLKKFLSATGSIYVHLDWHAAHYVKVLMDEIFGYNNFRNEIIWHYRSGGRSKQGFSFKHDTILSYSGGGEPYFDWQAVGETRGGVKRNNMKRGEDEDGRKYWSIKSSGKIYKYFDDEKLTPDDVWDQISHLQQKDPERLGYPTQKPKKLLERIITGSCPPGGLVLDCFMGSGTTCEVADSLGRRWIGIDSSKFSLHVARKRLLLAHQKWEDAAGKVQLGGPGFVHPFRIENIGLYQRGEKWHDLQLHESRYRSEIIRLFGGEPVSGFILLHGRKQSTWIHVGPLDGAVSSAQIWAIAKEAAQTKATAITVLSSDFDLLSLSEKDKIRKKFNVMVTVRTIPTSAVEQVARKLKINSAAPKGPEESMAVPVFFCPLAADFVFKQSCREVSLNLRRCEVDAESYLASQRPASRRHTGKQSASRQHENHLADTKWDRRRRELTEWLQKTTSWKNFVDFWAVDWNYGVSVDNAGRPIFAPTWQSFHLAGKKISEDGLAFTIEHTYLDAGSYQIAARVTDVFGNDGLSIMKVQVD